MSASVAILYRAVLRNNEELRNVYCLAHNIVMVESWPKTTTIYSKGIIPVNPDDEDMHSLVMQVVLSPNDYK